VATACAGLLRPVSLELGGKSAAIVLDDAAAVARDEIFGPVLSVITYGSDTDAVEIATDPDRATAVADAVQTGTIGINGYPPDLPGPFGGVRASGIGGEFGPEGLAAYQDLKSVYRLVCWATARRRRRPSAR
jgi:aldehyde dehydrogenase (NAD+)